MKNIFHKQHLSDSQIRFLKENLAVDIKSLFWYYNRHMLFLYRWFPNCRLIHHWLDFTAYIFINYYIKYISCLPDYNELLQDEYREIKLHLENCGIQIPLHGVGDVGGWGFFNGSYSSTFGFDRRINVNSGVFFLSHVLCRCLQPYIIEYDTNEKLPFYFKWHFRKQLKKIVIAHVMQTHSYALTKFFLIPEDDSLLYGIENFIVSHELGHAYFESVNSSDWPFKTSPSLKIRNRMDSDEEVRADIFAIHVLYSLYTENTNQKYLLFGPIFIFLFYSWLVDANLIKPSAYHPSHEDRWKYLLCEVQHLAEEYRIYNEFINKLNAVWESNKNKIIKSANSMMEKKCKDQAALDRADEILKEFLNSLGE